MNDKPFASLSGTLLARKGHAKPAMRPQAFNLVANEVVIDAGGAEEDDLGWNDMGHAQESVHPVALHPEIPSVLVEQVIPVVVTQQEQLLREFQPKVSAPPRAAAGSKGKAAFTLRLDAERHLRLRLVSAVLHRSAQQIVTQALDEFLDRQPESVWRATETSN